MNKVELQAKADSLTDEINFLRALYEAVRALISPASLPSPLFLSFPRKALDLSGLQRQR